jgi:L-aminopeptidase/D-esterase-like protein
MGISTTSTPRRVDRSYAGQAIDLASDGPVAEGSTGGGTGMNCYGFTGGNGTTSRVVQLGQDEFTVAVFIQANFGDRHELTVGGVPMGDLDVQCPMNDDG